MHTLTPFVICKEAQDLLQKFQIEYAEQARLHNAPPSAELISVETLIPKLLLSQGIRKFQLLVLDPLVRQLYRKTQGRRIGKFLSPLTPNPDPRSSQWQDTHIQVILTHQKTPPHHPKTTILTLQVQLTPG